MIITAIRQAALAIVATVSQNHKYSVRLHFRDTFDVMPLWSVEVSLVVLSCDPSSNGTLVVDMTIGDMLTMSECAEPVPFATGVGAFS
jgi:hypothetical protein